MTAPERMPDKLLIKLVDNPNSLCDGMYINAAGGNEYTRTDIHQAALDRIAELEGELAFYADQSKWRDCGFDFSEPGVMTLVHSSIDKDHGKRAIAVLAKGDG